MSTLPETARRALWLAAHATWFPELQKLAIESLGGEFVWNDFTHIDLSVSAGEAIQKAFDEQYLAPSSKHPSVIARHGRDLDAFRKGYAAASTLPAANTCAKVGANVAESALRTACEAFQYIADCTFDHDFQKLCADNISNINAILAAGAPAEMPKPESGWLPISTAPRDGTNILIRFGIDVSSQAKFIAGMPHPWQFIDTNDGITWLINHAIDGPGGPSHWVPFPAVQPIPARTAAGTPANTCAEMRAICTHCGGTGDVHGITGEWHGRCTCPAGARRDLGPSCTCPALPCPVHLAPSPNKMHPDAAYRAEYRTCCDHPDCQTCSGRGGFYRVAAPRTGALK